MNDFLNLINDEILNKISIDPRLIPSFKRVMKRHQAFFDANGYNNKKDYKAFFEMFLLTDNPDVKFQLQVNDEPSKMGAAGFYAKNENRLVIDEKYINSNPEELDSILSHEWIHFIVMHGLDLNYSSKEIFYGGFINEALTEMMNQLIYPNSRSYKPQVSMLTFANVLTNNINNYGLFLTGNIDAKITSASWNNFYIYAQTYHTELKDQSYKMDEAIKNENYIKAQRELIKTNIHSHLIKDFDTYIEKLSFLNNRPVKDDEFINNFIDTMENNFINSLRISNSNLKKILKTNLEKIREIQEKLDMHDDKEVCSFEYKGHIISIDKDMNYYSEKPLYGIVIQRNPDGIMILSNVKDKDIIKIDIKTIDFEHQKNILKDQKKILSGYFSTTSTKDIEMISNIARSQNGLLRIEKHSLPNIGFDNKKATQVIYIAHYEDRIEIINPTVPLGTIENVKLAQYHGITTKENGLISYKPLRDNVEGYKFSALTEIRINSEISSILMKKFEMLDEKTINTLIEEYKNSDGYQDETKPDELRESTSWYYIEKETKNLSPEKRKQLINEIINQNDQFVISSDNSNVEVALMFGKNSMFKANCEVLVDTKEFGLYNELYSELVKENEQNNTTSNLKNEVIKKDVTGNIKMPEKTDEQKLSSINNSLNKYQNEYSIVAKEIEDFMQKNSIRPKQNYDQELNKLLQRRDNIRSKMIPIIEQQYLIKSKIDSKKKEKHQNMINHIEQLLNTNITSSNGYVYDSELKVPIIISKTKSELMKEQNLLIDRLEQLMLTGTIERDVARELINTLNIEFNRMIMEAPKIRYSYSSNKETEDIEKSRTS